MIAGSRDLCRRDGRGRRDTRIHIVIHTKTSLMLSSQATLTSTIFTPIPNHLSLQPRQVSMVSFSSSA